MSVAVEHVNLSYRNRGIYSKSMNGAWKLV